VKDTGLITLSAQTMKKPLQMPFAMHDFQLSNIRRNTQAIPPYELNR